MENSYKKAEGILQSNIERLHLVAKMLIDKETIDGDEFEEIMQSNPIQPTPEA
ncbi:hypothetical protein SDC9_193068 [bioreactor metagenome]|uniref:ATP-dependent zinc metalloprotease FtsH n=1 Tax=bioreactor metagenome TaxID=1076179 RepID=A0A645I2H5_9ZZZZ